MNPSWDQGQYSARVTKKVTQALSSAKCIDVDPRGRFSRKYELRGPKFYILLNGAFLTGGDSEQEAWERAADIIAHRIEDEPVIGTIHRVLPSTPSSSLQALLMEAKA